MTILLDSHAVVWFLTGDRRCSARARAAIEDEAEVLVSAVSAWEIAAKVRLGRWREAARIAANLREVLERHNFAMLDVTLEHGLRAGSLAGPHRDPFDRMLAAQAEIEGLPLITADAAFRAFGIRTVW